MSGLARLWRLLTEAPTAVRESGRRRQVQLLSGLLVVLIPLVLLLIGLQLLLFPGFWPSFVVVASALVVLFLAYGLARIGQFTAGALLTVATSALTCFAVVILNPHDPIVYAFLNVSMFLARLLFNKTGVWITTLANLLGVLLLPVLGVPPPDGDPVVVPVFLIITAALLLLGTRYRDAVERDRQMELVASEARFRDFADATLEGVVFTENGSIIDINDRGAALLGVASSTALIGRNILDFCAPADRERMAALMRNNVTTPSEFSVHRVDDSEFPGEVCGHTSLYHNRPVRVTVLRDLTERRRAEEELRREREFTSTVFDTTGSLIVVLDCAGRIVRFNRTAEELTGYRFDEVRGQTPWDYFLSPDEAAAVETVFKRLTANDVVARYENHWRMRDGSHRLFDWSNRVITDSAGVVEYIVSVGVDITERKRAEQVTQRLNRLLNTLAAVNPALMRAESEAQLFAGVCRALVEQGEFSMAWVGLAGAATRRVTVACQSGFAHGYLENLDIRYDDSLQGQGPTGTAIRTGRTVINDDTEINTNFTPWLERSREHGYRSSMATPLRVHGQVIGSLNVYADTPHAFGSQEVVLLEKLAGDIGLALERQRAIDRIAASEHELATILQNMQDTYYRTDQEGRIVRASESATQLLGYTPGDMQGKRIADFYVDADGPKQFLAALKAAAGRLQNYETSLRHSNGSVVWVSTNAQYVRDADGRVIGVEGTTRDVTERKRAEGHLLDIARGVSATTGETFFHSLVAHLVQSLHANYAFVGELVPGQADRIRTIAVQAGDQRTENFEYDLVGTPCQNVVGRETCTYSGSVQEQFPDDHMLAEMGVHAYVGTPLFSGSGAALGLLVVLFRESIDEGLVIRSTLEIFAVRAAAELERLRAEQALRDSESLLAKAQEVARIGSWSWDIASNDVLWSRETYRLFGVTLEFGEHPWEILERVVHPDDREPLQQSIERTARTGEARPLEIRLIWADGTEHVLWAEGEMLRGPDGKPARMIGTMQDITERKLAEQALIQSESNFRALTENANVGILVNHRGKHVFANNRLLEMLGYTADEIRQTGVKELVHPLELDKVMACFRDRLDGKPAPNMYETVFMSKTGQEVPVELTAATTTWQGEPAGLVMLQDIRERLRTEEQMRKLSSALEQTADSVMITDRAGVIEYVNPAFQKTTGYSRAEALGQTPRLVKSGKQGASFYKKLWSTILTGEVFSDVFVNRRKDGSLYYEEKTITPLMGSTGQIANFVATGKDVTERVQTQERLQHMAQHDALTELPNRGLFMDRLKQALARARWHERMVAVLFVDMDRFKNINDTLGHEAGDRLLQALAERFTSGVREGDTVARFGGDEFVILLDDVASDKDIGIVANKILETLAPPFTIDGQGLYITASIGVSLYPNDGEDSGTLIKNADIAMYRAKELGKNTYQFYSADMSARAFERLTLESSLRHAIERNEFRLYYQPQVDTASGTIIGVEALLRWQHPDFGLVAPADFTALLEETGLVVPVGEWVFQTACKQLCAWHAAGWPALRMAVNLSPRQFHVDGLARMIERGLATVGCDPGLIELEITENVLLQHTATTLEALEALEALGVRMAIDDFGTGYSSLSYLRRYSIDTLKIDRSFVHDVPGDADDSALVSAIIVLAQSLKLNVIAEGVETEAQREFLQARGCRIMQGFLFSRSLPADELTALLGKQPDQS